MAGLIRRGPLESWNWVVEFYRMQQRQQSEPKAMSRINRPRYLVHQAFRLMSSLDPDFAMLPVIYFSHQLGSNSWISSSVTPSQPPHPHRNPYFKYNVKGVHDFPYEIVSSWPVGMWSARTRMMRQLSTGS